MFEAKRREAINAAKSVISQPIPAMMTFHFPAISAVTDDEGGRNGGTS
jgi:hypothetical protein